MTTPELTVEQALAELRRMFPDIRVSVAEKRRLLAFPDVKLELDEEFHYLIVVGKGWDANDFSAPTLSEAMAQVRKFRSKQQ